MTKDFQSFYKACSELITRKFHLSVQETDLPSGITGNFNGTTIKIQPDLEPEMKLFILLHLFGHTVQWNISSERRAFGLRDLRTEKITKRLLLEAKKYERQASRYGLNLLQRAGLIGYNQWLADLVAADWRYLQTLYTAGKKIKPFNHARDKRFWQAKSKLLRPLRIPRFKPQVWNSRYSF